MHSTENLFCNWSKVKGYFYFCGLNLIILSNFSTASSLLNNIDKEYISALDAIIEGNQWQDDAASDFQSKLNQTAYEISLLDRIDYLNNSQVIVAATLLRVPGYKMVMHRDAFEPASDWRLKPQAVVYVPNKVAGIQISEVNPSLDIKVFTSGDLLDNLHSKNFECTVIDRVISTQHLDDNYLVFPISPMELTPPAGQGTFVVVTDKENMSMRKKAAKWHNSTISDMTNIERKLSSELLEQGHIHISPMMNNYQVTFAVLKNGGLIKKTLNVSSIGSLNTFISHYI